MLAEIHCNSAFKLSSIYTHKNMTMKDLFKIPLESTVAGQKRLKKKVEVLREQRQISQPHLYSWRFCITKPLVLQIRLISKEFCIHTAARCLQLLIIEGWQLQRWQLEALLSLEDSCCFHITESDQAASSRIHCHIWCYLVMLSSGCPDAGLKPDAHDSTPNTAGLDTTVGE